MGHAKYAKQPLFIMNIQVLRHVPARRQLGPDSSWSNIPSPGTATAPGQISLALHAQIVIFAMRLSCPFSILLGTAGFSILLSILVVFHASNRISLMPVNPTSLYEIERPQGHEADNRIAEEYMASLKSLTLRERQLNMQVYVFTSFMPWILLTTFDFKTVQSFLTLVVLTHVHHTKRAYRRTIFGSLQRHSRLCSDLNQSRQVATVALACVLHKSLRYCYNTLTLP